MRGSAGRNWLMCGEQHEATDFLHQDELLAWEKSGHLDRLDLAWSRDQGKKVYVQHKIEEKNEAFWDWMENGAVIYVCGDKARMAADVEREIVHLAIENGVVENDPAAVKAWIRSMKKEKRYQLDVY
jgi:sulfite reductase (NADPH) flavoprotein alpha-component